MAVVESAADGLSSLSMPTLGLGMPHNFAHIASESNQLQLHHHYHHHQLHHHQQLLQNTQTLSDFIDDEKAQQSGRITEREETLTTINAELVGSLQTSKYTSTNSITSIDGITSNYTSTHGITSNRTLLNGELGCSAAKIKSLAHPNHQLGSSQTLVDNVEMQTDSTALSSSFDQTQIAANAVTAGDGKALRLPIEAPLSANADPSMQFEKDSIRKLEDLLSKLNPLAEEFVPSSSSTPDAGQILDNSNHKKKNGYSQGRRRGNGRTSKAQREESIRRTVYVSDIDQQVTEEQLAALFITCGPVVDCRVCGDPNSVLRFAFVEFTNEAGARAALSLAGTMLGYYPVRVLPSKTAIVPVNPTFLPRSEDEREMCARTIYCTNIDKKVSQADVKLFFETLCGEVARLRLLGDYRHSTRIAFVEFVRAESAMAALNCSGAILGSLPLRVSPSKTPVRPRSPRLL